MNSDIEHPFNLPYSEVRKRADLTLQSVLNQIQTGLEKITQHITDQTDSSLINCWEEICVQRQSEEFYGWSVYETTIELVVEGCFDSLNQEEKRFVNFAVLNELDDIEEPDYECVYEEAILEFLGKKILEIALNYTNPRIEAYLDPGYHEFDEPENRYDPDEYVLLRIDPAKRDDFLAALTLFGFVEHIEIDEQSVPFLADLLDNVDVVDNQ